MPKETMKTYYITAIVDTRRNPHWVLHGHQNRAGKFRGRRPRVAQDRAVAYWSKQLRGSENVVVTSVRPI